MKSPVRIPERIIGLINGKRIGGWFLDGKADIEMGIEGVLIFFKHSRYPFLEFPEMFRRYGKMYVET